MLNFLTLFHDGLAGVEWFEGGEDIVGDILDQVVGSVLVSVLFQVDVVFESTHQGLEGHRVQDVEATLLLGGQHAESADYVEDEVLHRYKDIID